MTNPFNSDMLFENHTNLPANESRDSSIQEGCLNHLFRMAGTKPIQEENEMRTHQKISREHAPLPEPVRRKRHTLDTYRPVLETARRKLRPRELLKEAAKFTEPKEKKLTTSVPAEMTRIPLFEIDSRRFKKECVFDKKVIYDNVYGRATMEGPLLSIFDEDILLILIHLMKKHGQLYFHTSLYEICSVKGTVVRKNTTNAIWESLERITKTSVMVETKKDMKQGRFRAIFHLVDKASLREGNKSQIRIRISDYFNGVWGKDMITHMDLRKRLELKGDITKALHRFLEGQSGFQTGGMLYLPLLTVVGTLNLEGQDLRTLRWQVKNAIRKLIDTEYLKEASGINRHDTVFFWRILRRKPIQGFS